MAIDREASASLGARRADAACGGRKRSREKAPDRRPKGARPPLIGADGKPLSMWQAWLRRLCIVVIVWAVLEIAFAVGLGIAGFLLPQVGVAGITLGALAVTVGITALVSAALNLVIGLLGIRGASNPYKITLFFWITLADAVLTSWAMASNISSGIIDVTGIVSGLFIIALAVCAWQVRGQTGYFDIHP